MNNLKTIDEIYEILCTDIEEFSNYIENGEINDLGRISTITAMEFLLKNISEDTLKLDNKTDLKKNLEKEIGNKLSKVNLCSENAKEKFYALYLYKKICNMNEAEDRVANTISTFKKDIYKDSLHFFLEIFQNADDASKSGTEHKLKILINSDNKIKFIYDERGFDFLDIYAITSIGNSSKLTKNKVEDDEATIGEKGIGFKSIFSIVKKVNIDSGYYNFYIEDIEEDPSNILIPYLNDVRDKWEKKTEITLEFKEKYLEDNGNLEKVKEWLREKMDSKKVANPFLFLKNICTIEYCEDMDSSKNKVIKIKKEEKCYLNSGKNQFFQLVKVGDEKYLKYSSTMSFNREDIVSRWEFMKDIIDDEKSIKRNAEICFPLEALSEESVKGQFYSYLPTEIEINFPILVNLDVHLTASRGDIKIDDFSKSLWNEKVEKNLPSFLQEAYVSIVKFNDSDTKKELTGIIKEVKEQLYRFLPNYIKDASTNKGTYDNQLKKFFAGEDDFEGIIDKEIFYAKDKLFKKRTELCIVLAEVVKEGENYSQYNTRLNNYDIMQRLYSVLGEYETFITKSPHICINRILNLNNTDNVNSNWCIDYKWNNFLGNIYNQKPCNQFVLDTYSIIKFGNGIKKIWKTTKNIDIESTIESIIEILNGKGTSRGKEDYFKMEIVPVEMENDFEIKSFESIIKEKKAVFFHGQNTYQEDKENSYYIKEGSFKNIKSFLENKLEIKQYELNDYFDKLVEEKLNEQESIEKVKDIFDLTYQFYKANKNCFEHVKKKERLKKILNKYTIEKSLWKSAFSKGISGVNQEYIEALFDDKLRGNLLIINSKDFGMDIQNEDDLICRMEYLIYLGVKSKIDFENETIDFISTIIIIGVIKIDEGLRKYYLDTFNSQIELISKNNLINLLKYIGYISSFESDTIKKENKELICISKNNIENYDKVKSELKYNNEDTFTLFNSSKYFVVEKEKYSNINKEIGIKEFAKGTDIEKEFIISFPSVGDYFVKYLRFIKIINASFGLGYVFGYDGKKTALNWEAFISVYPVLSKENLIELMKSGCCVNLDASFVSFFEYFKKYDDLSEFIRLNDLYNDLIGMVLIYEDKDNKIENEKLIKVDCGEDTLNEKFVFIKELKDSDSDSIIKIINGLPGVKLSEFQKKLIKDYCGESREACENPKELLNSGYPIYEKGTFLRFHRKELEFAKKYISENKISIWNKKQILEQLCQPYRLSNNKYMEGYGYRCPICGTKSYAALNALTFDRFFDKNNNKIYIVSCLNCNKMLRTANEIEINDFDMLMKEFDKVYLSDNNHPTNNAIMKSVILKVKTFDNKDIMRPMKLSYLNMILYQKDINKK